jgi:hypothetical protein
MKAYPSKKTKPAIVSLSQIRASLPSDTPTVTPQDREKNIRERTAFATGATAALVSNRYQQPSVKPQRSSSWKHGLTARALSGSFLTCCSPLFAVVVASPSTRRVSQRTVIEGIEVSTSHSANILGDHPLAASDPVLGI